MEFHFLISHIHSRKEAYCSKNIMCMCDRTTLHPTPQHLVMLHPTPFLGVLIFFFSFTFFIWMESEHAQAQNKQDWFLFHNFGHYFHPLLSVLMYLQELQDFSGEGSDSQYVMELSTSHSVG